MKKITFLSGLFILMILMFISCGFDSSQEFLNEKTDLSLALEWVNEVESDKNFVGSNAIPSEVKYIKVSILDDGLPLITKIFPAEDGQAVFPLVPVATDRQVLVNALSSDSTVLYTGYTVNVDFEPEEITDIRVHMYMNIQGKPGFQSIFTEEPNTIMLRWSSVFLAEKYELQMSDDISSFDNSSQIYLNEETSYLVEELSFNEYYFRVLGKRNIPVFDNKTEKYKVNHIFAIRTSWSDIIVLKIDENPITISHTPIDTSVVGSPVNISVSVTKSDDIPISNVELRFRNDTFSDFYSLPMEEGSAGLFSVTIPGIYVSTDYFEYYISVSNYWNITSYYNADGQVQNNPEENPIIINILSE